VKHRSFGASQTCMYEWNTGRSMLHRRVGMSETPVGRCFTDVYVWMKHRSVDASQTCRYEWNTGRSALHRLVCMSETPVDRCFTDLYVWVKHRSVGASQTCRYEWNTGRSVLHGLVCMSETPVGWCRFSYKGNTVLIVGSKTEYYKHKPASYNAVHVSDLPMRWRADQPCVCHASCYAELTSSCVDHSCVVTCDM